MADNTFDESKRLLSSQSLTRSSSAVFPRNDSGAGRRPMDYVSINSSPDDDSRERHAAVYSRYKYYSRLAPHPDNPMVIPDHVVPTELWTRIPVTPEGKQGSLITIFSIWNTMMGTSLLSMPWAIGQAGLGLGVGFMVLMAFLTLYTSYRVMKSINTIAHQGGVMEFSDVCKHYLGRVGEATAVVFSVVCLLGGAIVYWVLMSNFLYNTVSFIYADVKEGKHLYPDVNNESKIFHDEYINCTDVTEYKAHHRYGNSSVSLTRYNGPHNTTTLIPSDPSEVSFHEYWDLQKTVPFFLVLVLYPLIHFKSPTFFTKFNAVGTISVIYLLGFVTYKSIIWGVHLDFSKVPGSYVESSFPALTGVLCLAYFIHNCVLSIVRNQAKPENNTRDLTIAFICVSITYMYVGIMFYIMWPMYSKVCIDQNLLNNFSTGDPLAFVARIFLFIQMLTVFPLLLYVMRIQVMHAIFNSIWPSWKHVVVLNTVVVGICLIFARFFPQIGSIIRYTGAICALVYAFFLPCTTYMLSEKKEGRLTITKIIIHVSLIMVGLANFIAQFLI